MLCTSLGQGTLYIEPIIFTIINVSSWYIEYCEYYINVSNITFLYEIRPRGTRQGSKFNMLPNMLMITSHVLIQDPHGLRIFDTPDDIRESSKHITLVIKLFILKQSPLNLMRLN